MKYPMSPMPKQSSCPTNERLVFSQNLAIANKPANGINKAARPHQMLCSKIRTTVQILAIQASKNPTSMKIAAIPIVVSVSNAGVD